MANKTKRQSQRRPPHGLSAIASTSSPSLVASPIRLSKKRPANGHQGPRAKRACNDKKCEANCPSPEPWHSTSLHKVVAETNVIAEAEAASNHITHDAKESRSSVQVEKVLPSLNGKNRVVRPAVGPRQHPWLASLVAQQELDTLLANTAPNPQPVLTYTSRIEAADPNGPSHPQTRGIVQVGNITATKALAETTSSESQHQEQDSVAPIPLSGSSSSTQTDDELFSWEEEHDSNDPLFLRDSPESVTADDPGSSNGWSSATAESEEALGMSQDEFERRYAEFLAPERARNNRASPESLHGSLWNDEDDANGDLELFGVDHQQPSAESPAESQSASQPEPQPEVASNPDLFEEIGEYSDRNLNWPGKPESQIQLDPFNPADQVHTGSHDFETGPQDTWLGDQLQYSETDTQHRTGMGSHDVDTQHQDKSLDVGDLQYLNPDAQQHVDIQHQEWVEEEVLQQLRPIYQHETHIGSHDDPPHQERLEEEVSQPNTQNEADPNAYRNELLRRMREPARIGTTVLPQPPVAAPSRRRRAVPRQAARAQQQPQPAPQRPSAPTAATTNRSGDPAIPNIAEDPWAPGGVFDLELPAMLARNRPARPHLNDAARARAIQINNLPPPPVNVSVAPGRVIRRVIRRAVTASNANTQTNGSRNPRRAKKIRRRNGQLPSSNPSSVNGSSRRLEPSQISESNASRVSTEHSLLDASAGATREQFTSPPPANDSSGPYEPPSQPINLATVPEHGFGLGQRNFPSSFSSYFGPMPVQPRANNMTIDDSVAETGTGLIGQERAQPVPTHEEAYNEVAHQTGSAPNTIPRFANQDAGPTLLRDMQLESVDDPDVRNSILFARTPGQLHIDWTLESLYRYSQSVHAKRKK